MFKKKKIIVLAFLLLLVSYTIQMIYKKYYMIRFEDFHVAYLASYADSPDGEHAVSATTYKTEMQAEEVYICIVLYTQKEDESLPDSKIIIWDKVPAIEIETSAQSRDRPDHSVYVKWVDNKTIMVNGRVFDINKRYDYRRNLKD